MPDEKCSQAIQEINEVLKKHDLAGVIFLASPSHTHFLYRLDPTWSCVKMEEGGRGIRVRAMEKDFPSKEAQKKCLEDSIGMIMGFATNCNHAEDNFSRLVELIGKKMEITHIDRFEPPHESQSL